MRGFRHFILLGAMAALLQARTAPAFPAVVLNEFMAINDTTYQSRDGAYADWIELYNNTTNTVSLDGWYLTDRAGDLTKWRFPDVGLDPHGYLVVFASGDNEADPARELHTSFSLSGDGEYLGLVSNDGVTVVSEYIPAYPPQAADVSYGLHSPTNTLGLYFMTPTPGAANTGGTPELGPRMVQAASVVTGMTAGAYVTLTARVDRTLHDIERSRPSTGSCTRPNRPGC